MALLNSFLMRSWRVHEQKYMTPLRAIMLGSFVAYSSEGAGEGRGVAAKLIECLSQFMPPCMPPSPFFRATREKNGRWENPL